MMFTTALSKGEVRNTSEGYRYSLKASLFPKCGVLRVLLFLGGVGMKYWGFFYMYYMKWILVHL